MSEVRLIPGFFEAGERLQFQDFMDLRIGSVVWGKADRFEGPLQIQGIDGNARVLTDGDKIGISIEFPNVASPESAVGAFTPVGQMEFFEAIPIFDRK